MGEKNENSLYILYVVAGSLGSGILISINARVANITRRCLLTLQANLNSRETPAGVNAGFKGEGQKGQEGEDPKQRSGRVSRSEVRGGVPSSEAREVSLLGVMPRSED